MVNLTDNVLCFLTAPLTSHSPILFPHLGPPSSPRHNKIEIRLINNPTVASQRSSERKSFMSLILNEKLEKVRLSEESMLKAETDQELDLFC